MAAAESTVPLVNRLLLCVVVRVAAPAVVVADHDATLAAKSTGDPDERSAVLPERAATEPR